MEKDQSHYKNLLHILVDKQKRDEGIAVSTVPPLMARTDNGSIFEEGDVFSGNVKQNQAEASLTVTSSPHFRGVMPLSRFVSTARREFGVQSQLPQGFGKDGIVSPHLLIWWRNHSSERSNKVDLFDLHASSQEIRTDVIYCVEKQTVKALRLLDEAEGLPIIYGTWGHATREERIRYGLSRGGPSVADGHLHVAKINEADQEITLRQDLTTTQRLKHFEPWNRLINASFGEGIAQAIRCIADRSAVGIDVDSVAFNKRTMRYAQGRESLQEGYEVNFKSPLQFKDAFSLVVDVAGKFEILYKGLSELYSAYNKNIGDKAEQASIKEKMCFMGASFGFSEAEANNLADFVAAIRPTYGQVREWKAQLEQEPLPENHEATLQKFDSKIKKRNRFTKLLSSASANQSLRAALLHDTYKEPDAPDIAHTLPAHASAAYLFDDIAVSGDKILVKKFTLLPCIVSTAGAPERILGVEIVRDTGING